MPFIAFSAIFNVFWVSLDEWGGSVSRGSIVTIHMRGGHATAHHPWGRCCCQCCCGASVGNVLVPSKMRKNGKIYILVAPCSHSVRGAVVRLEVWAVSPWSGCLPALRCYVSTEKNIQLEELPSCVPASLRPCLRLRWYS